MKSRSWLAVLLCLNFTSYQSSLAQSPSGIVADGRTQTTVTTNGNVTGVTTSTVRGANGYNSFTTFNVGNGKIANLYLPGSTKNLFNLVNGSPTTINGILNSIKDGQIGGRVFFINPYGMVVGSTGVINVGALTVLTPSKSFNESLIDAKGNVSDEATNAVLAGNIPLTSDGLILVRGRINAIGDIRLAAGQIVNSGRIGTGAVFVTQSPTFGDVVNVNGLRAATQIGTSNGDIVILAVNDFENSGTITTQGTTGVNGGNIDIRASNDIRLIGNSLISSSGIGNNSNAGNIRIIAEGNASLLDHAQIRANGGNISGNGGAVEFSARRTLTINGGNLSAGAVNGTAGSILLDPTDLVLNTSQNSGGADITIDADNSITIGCATTGCNQGSSTVTISSQNLNTSGTSKGDSGDISITAPKITLLDNSQVLAGATGAYQAGDVTLTAIANDESANANADASITVGKATITGNNITFSASATAKADGSSDGQSSTTLRDSSMGFSLDGVAASADISKATASINIGNAMIDATGDIKLEATSSSTAKVSLTDSSIGVAYGQSDSTASVNIASGADIKADGTVDVKAKAENEFEVSASSKDASALSAAVAFGKGTSASTVQIDGKISAGTISATSEVENNFSTEAKGTNESPTGGGSGAGVGVALAFYDSTATNNVTGTLTADTGDMTISATSTNKKNSTKSESSVSKNAEADKLKESQKELDGLDKFLGDSSKQKKQPKEESNSSALGIAAAVTYVNSSNKATTNVSGSVTATNGNIKVSSTATDSPGMSAAGSASDSKVALGGALALGNYSNSADTEVTGSAVLNAKGIELTSSAEITNPVLDPVNTIVKDFDFKSVDFSKPVDEWATTLWNNISGFYDGVQALKGDLEDPTVFTTSYTNTGLSAEGSGSVGIAGSVNLITLNNSATTAVQGKAKVTATTGDVKLSSDAKATMINASGMAFTKDQLKDRNPGVSAGSSLGGSYLGADLTNTSKTYIGDNTGVTASGNVDLDASTETLAIDIYQSGDKAEKFGITGAFASTNITDKAEAYIQSNATVNAGKDVSVDADNTLKAFSVGGALGVGGQLQVGVTGAWNHINQTTLAYIGDLENTRTTTCAGCGVTASGKVSVDAQSNEKLFAISFAAAASGLTGKGADGESKTEPTGKEAPKAEKNSLPDEKKPENKNGDNGAGGGKYGFGISADVAFNDVTDSSGGPGVTTKAFINNGTNVTATSGDVNVNAQDSSFAVAAGVAGAVANGTALAGAYGQNTFSKEVDAFTANSDLTAKGLNLTASTDSDVFNVTAGGAVNTVSSSGIALAGSVNNNSITNNTSAYIGDDTIANIGVDGTTISAGQTGTVVSVAGALGLALNGAGIGAAIDIGEYTSNVSAKVEDAQLTSIGNVQITASNDENLWPVAASAGIGSKFGASGSVAYEKVRNQTTAEVNGHVTTDANLVIGSEDQTEITNIAGSLGIGGNAAIAISAIIPSVRRTTTATIGGTADVTALGSTASPLSYQGIDVVGTLVHATSGGSLSDYSIGAAVAGDVAAAGAVIVNPLSSTSEPESLFIDTKSKIAGGAKVNSDNAGANDSQSVAVKASDTTTITDVAGALSASAYAAGGVGYDQVQSKWNVKAEIGKDATVKAAADVIVDSTLKNSIDSYGFAVSGSGGVSLAGAVSRIMETTTSSASIDGTVSADGNVIVAANRNGSLNTLDGNGAIGGAGFGLSLSMVTANDTVEAFIGPEASVTALGNGSAISVPTGEFDADGNPLLGSSFHGLSVTATNYSSVTPMVVGAAVAGGLALEGSITINTLTENTSAEIRGGAVVNDNNDGATDAESVSVLASDSTNIDDLAGALSVSAGAGFGAAVDTGNITKTTTAGIGNEASVNANGALTVNALSKENIDSVVAAIGGAISVGVAGAAGDYSVSPTTTAYIGSCTSATECTSGATVNAGTVSVQATDNLTLDQTAGAVGVGITGVGLGAGVLVIKNNAITRAYIGGLSDITSADQTSVRASSTDSLTGTSLAGAGGVVGADAAIVSLTDNSSSSAFVADEAVVTSEGDVDVVATNNRTINGKTSGLAIGVIAGGASVTDVTVNGGTTAYIGGTDVTSQTSALNVTAQLTDSVTASADGIGGGLVSAIGTDPHVTDNATTEAYVTGGAILSSAGTTTIDAEANRTLTATSGSISVGGAAAGMSFAEVDLGGKTRAYTASGAQIGTLSNHAGGLIVSASETDTGTATATALAGGVFAGVGGQTDVNLTPDVAASMTGTMVYADGDVSVAATETSTVNSSVKANTYGVITGGSSDAHGTLTPIVSASITGGTVQAGGISVGAEGSQTLNVNSSSSASDSFVSGMSVDATATSTPTVTASVGGEAVLTASEGVLISANSTNSTPSVTGDGTAGLSVGSGGTATANVSITNNVSTSVGEATITSTDGDLTVQSRSDNSITKLSSLTQSGSGIVNVGGATTNAIVIDNVSTTLASGADLEASAGELVVASYGSEKVVASATNPNGLSGVAQSEAETNVGIAANVKSSVQDGANVDGKDTTVKAEIAGLDATLDAGATSNASAKGVLGVGAYATSIMNTTASTNVDISNGATVAGNHSLTLDAEIGKASLVNLASADAKAGIVPISEATAINNANLAAGVNVAPGSTLVSDSLTVNALKPVGSNYTYSNTASARYTFYAIFGIPISGNGTRNVSGTASNNNSININGLLQQPAGLPALLVNADGTYSGSLGVLGEDANNIVLNDIDGSDSAQSVVLNAPGGKVQGSLQINPNLLLVNNSDRNLVIQDISAQSSGPGNVSITGDGSSFTSTVGPMPITIQNNGASNVVFTGDVTDAGGSLAVTNQGGSILGTQDNTIKVSSANLFTPNGGIGSTGGEIACLTAGCPGTELQLSSINLFLTPILEAVTGTLSPGELLAVARNDINLNLTPDATAVAGISSDSSIPVQLNGIVAGGDLNLTLNSGLILVEGGQTQINSDYQIRSGDWAGAGGLFNVVMNGTEGASPTLTVNGTLTSGFETISVTANADGTFTSLVGAAGQGTAQLDYAHADGDAVQIDDLDASRSGISITGTGNLVGNGTVAVLNGASNIAVANHTDQLLAVNAITNGATGTANIALNGTVSLTPTTYGSSSGRIDVSSDTTSVNLQHQLNNPSGTVSITSGADITGASGTTLIRSKNIELAAGGSIGPDLGVVMTQASGVLNARAIGSIGLTAAGDISIGNLSSQTADVSISSSGSILSADSMYQPNISGRNITLTADGTIGSSDAWLSTQAAGTLNASAGSDIYMRQISGDLNSESMVSGNGGINIIVDKGNGYLQQIRAAKNVLLLVNGDLLNIGVIDSDKIKIMLAGEGGVATVGNMFVGSSVDFVADISHILRLVHTRPTNPLLFDIPTTEGGYNQRPIGPGIVLMNSLANVERREQERRFGLKNRAEPAANYVIDKRSQAAEPGVAQ